MNHTPEPWQIAGCCSRSFVPTGVDRTTTVKTLGTAVRKPKTDVPTPMKEQSATVELMSTTLK